MKINESIKFVNWYWTLHQPQRIILKFQYLISILVKFQFEIFLIHRRPFQHLSLSVLISFQQAGLIPLFLGLQLRYFVLQTRLLLNFKLYHRKGLHYFVWMINFQSNFDSDYCQLNYHLLGCRSHLNSLPLSCFYQMTQKASLHQFLMQIQLTLIRFLNSVLLNPHLRQPKPGSKG